MSIELKPIGFVKTDEKKLPQCWRMSDVEGDLVIDKVYTKGIKDIQKGQYIFVIFHFHKSERYKSQFLVTSHDTSEKKFGVFSTHSQNRPNPIGMAFLEVLDVKENIIRIKGLDMENNTPILDIKPDACPWDN